MPARFNTPPGSSPASEHRDFAGGLWRLTLCSLGIVFGDIGTSPLYTLKECLIVAARDRPVEQADLFGILSLMFWSLVMVVTVKYIVFVMRADHDGEGGILALLSLVPERFRGGRRGSSGIPMMTLLAIVGAALLYADGVITPAISVLSAVEGLAVANPGLSAWVVPITCAILVALFAIQKQGTGRVGRLFGPIMLLWFLTLAGLGLRQILHRPDVLASLLPWHGVEFFQRHGWHGLLILGSVVLVVTGGEALYADMGHFGLRPIRRAWLMIVLPALVLAYLGQGAIILEDPAKAVNPFYALAPSGPATYALVALASLATIIASQALISGAFSLTRQAMLLGFLPRVTIRHTAYESEGQIYIPEVNVMLGVGCIAIVLTFRESVKLAAAYGLAVTGTMLMTTVLFYLVIRHTWGWSRMASLAVLVLFLLFDLPFLVANLFKFFDGGYVPMLIGAGLLAAMLIWSRGRTALMEHYSDQHGPFEVEWPRLKPLVVARVPGTAVFLATSRDHLPPVLVHHIRSTRALHEAVVILTVADSPRPEVPDADRATVERLPDGFYRIEVRFGYMEQPLLIPHLRATAAGRDLPISLDAVTFFIGHSTIVADRTQDWAFIPEAIFAYLERNAVREDRRYGLPADRVLEIGEQISI